MTITSIDAQEIISGDYQVTWTSDLVAPLFHVYVSGLLREVTAKNSISLEVSDGDFPVIQVSDTGPINQAVGSGSIFLEWPQVADALEYRVEEWNGATYDIRTVIKDDGSPTYGWTSPPTPDETASQFRITAVGINGTDSIATVTTLETPRHPAIPEVTFVYNDVSNELTIAEF